MKFQCSSIDLVNAIQVATRALSARTTQPILEHVLVECLHDGIRLTGSDGTFTIITHLNAIVEQEGACLMPGKLFSEVARKLPQGAVSASLSPAFTLTLRCMGSRTNIAGQSPDAYPPVTVGTDAKQVTLPQNLLKSMIQSVSFAVAADDTRIVLTGGYLDMLNGEVYLVALDGFRMALRLARVSDTESRVSAIVPAKSLDEIAKLLSDDDDKQVCLNISSNQLTVDLGETRVFSRLIEGEFIDYKKVMPKSFETVVRVDRETLSRCVDRASLMAREGKNNLIKFTIEGNKLFLTSNSEVGDVFEELDVENEGGDIVIAFNVRYMLEIMRVANAERLSLKFNSPVSPCVISPADGDEFIYLVLPVRIDA